MRWTPEGAVAFRRTDEPFGFLSNMAAGFPLSAGGREWRTSEALYQAARFPLAPDLQEEIRSQASPMAAKMVTKPHRELRGRGDWEAVRLEVMRWVLRLKVLQGPGFGAKLASTHDLIIIEDSRKDRFWGAVASGDTGVLHGENWLGRLLMEVRSEVDVILRAGVVFAPPCRIVLFGEEILTTGTPEAPESEQMSFGV